MVIVNPILRGNIRGFKPQMLQLCACRPTGNPKGVPVRPHGPETDQGGIAPGTHPVQGCTHIRRPLRGHLVHTTRVGKPHNGTPNYPLISLRAAHGSLVVLAHTPSKGVVKPDHTVTTLSMSRDPPLGRGTPKRPL